MSKYQKFTDLMGSPALWNDKTTTGRVLKWELSSAGTPKKERDAIAAAYAKKFADAGIPVQKVQVRNATSSRTFCVRGKGGKQEYETFESVSYDKLSVYIDPI